MQKENSGMIALYAHLFSLDISRNIMSCQHHLFAFGRRLPCRANPVFEEV